MLRYIKQECDTTARMYQPYTHKMIPIKRCFLLAMLCFTCMVGSAQSSFQIDLRVTDRYAGINAIRIGDVLLFLDPDYENIHLPASSDMDFDYYDRFDRDELRGKFKYTGGVNIEYYDIFDRSELMGKIKSIGSVKFTYYDIFERSELVGKLKSVGDIQLKYYDVFDRSELMGKLKSVGDIRLTYFDAFDLSINTGKVKSVNGKMPQVNVTVSRNSGNNVTFSEY